MNFAAEAPDLIERFIKTEPYRSVYDALLLPAFSYAERDRLEQRLSVEGTSGTSASASCLGRTDDHHADS